MNAFSRAGLIGAAGLMLSGCGTALIQSSWDPDLAAIPRRRTADTRQVIPTGDKRLRAAFTNDVHELHIVAVTGDEGLMRLAERAGLIFWFDASGGKERTFGIRYPVHDAWAPGTPGPQRGERFDDGPRPGGFTSDEVEICGPGDDDRHRMTLAETGGISASLHRQQDSLVIELTVPLTDDNRHPFNIGTTPGALIGVGIVTEMPHRPAMATRMGMEGGMSPREGGEGDAGGFGGRGRRGERMERANTGGERPSQLDVWVKLQLATGSSPTH